MAEDGTVWVSSQPVQSVAEDSQAQARIMCPSGVEVVSDTVPMSGGGKIAVGSQAYKRMNFAQARAVVWGLRDVRIVTVPVSDVASLDCGLP